MLICGLLGRGGRRVRAPTIRGMDGQPLDERLLGELRLALVVPALALAGGIVERARSLVGASTLMRRRRCA